MVVVLVLLPSQVQLLCWYCYRSTKAKYREGGAFLSDKFGAEALPYLDDGY